MRLTLEDLLPDRSQVRSVRPVTEADLPALKDARGGTPPRKKLRYKHHVLARLLASGMQERTAAVVSGFAPVTVSILKKDPAFAALVKFYETEKGKGFDHVRAQILGVGQKFIEEMERRVTEAPEEIPMRDLRETATVLLDRAGYAPQQQHQHEVHVHVGLANAVESSRVAAPKLTYEPEGRGHGPAGALGRNLARRSARASRC